MKRRIVFLDRDGVINEDFGYVYKIEDFKLKPKVLEALKILNLLNYEIIIVTNQSGIARGYYKEEDFLKLTKYMLDCFNNYNIKVKKVLYCPHHKEGNVLEFKKDCDCRKPNIGLVTDILNEIDKKNSYMIGDKNSDIEFGKNLGVKTVFINNKEKINNSADFIFDSLFEFVLSLKR